MRGVIHSIESMGAVDGPGLRTVVFFQGCRLQCKFCHSIDTTVRGEGEEIEAAVLAERVLRNREYWGKKMDGEGEISGGVTISGGDPINQYQFAIEVIEHLKRVGAHLTFETALFGDRAAVEALIPHVDLWMVSIKHVDSERCRELTGAPNLVMFENLRLLDDQFKKEGSKRKIRIRYVLIPGVNDSEEELIQLGRFVEKIGSLEKLELLPYVTLGVHKWITLFGKYDLEGVPEATPNDLSRAANTLSQFGVELLF